MIGNARYLATSPATRRRPTAAPAAGGLRLVTLGAFECHSAAGRLRVMEAEPLLGGLLVYLAVNRRATTAELARIFLRSDDDGDLLAPVVASIEEQVGPGVLSRRGDVIRADRGLDADVRKFEAAHRLGDYPAAAETYGGPFLPGAERAQGEQFAEWVRQRRLRLAAMHLEARERTQVCRVFEAVGDEVLLVDWRGAVLHRSPSLAQVLDDCAGGAALLRQVERLGRTVAGEGGEKCTLELPCGGHRLSISAVPMPDSSGDPVCVIVVRRLGTRWPGIAALRSSFALTGRQARVAILIAEGRTNDDIADTLCVSPHTVRRHTEMILSKLGVRTRGAVAAKLLAARRNPPA